MNSPDNGNDNVVGPETEGQEEKKSVNGVAIRCPAVKIRSH